MSEQPNHPGMSDERVESIIGNLLRIGVFASALVVFAGGIFYLIREGRQPAPDLKVFQKQPDGFSSLDRIFGEALALHSLGLIMFGLLLLIATPVARVIFSVVVFALQHDLLYVVFTLIVLGVLLYSLFSGYLSGSGAG